MRRDPHRETEWLLTSPALFVELAGLPLMPVNARTRLARALHDAPSAPDDESPAQVHRPVRAPLGHRAEHLLAAALARCPGIDLIASRLPIVQNGRTVGEIDLLYDDHARQSRIHCEVSVRLLLQHRPASAWDAWCGTDPRQVLSDKLAHLRDHQLPLGAHPAVPRHPTWPTVSEALLLGWFLQPAGNHWPEADGASPDHLRGWWLRHGIAEPLRSSRAARFALIPSQDWLGLLHLPSSTPVLAPGQLSEQLARHFARHDHAVLVAEVVRSADGGWREIHRGAVVHRRWPERP